jgi:hypothetical protein
MKILFKSFWELCIPDTVIFVYVEMIFREGKTYGHALLLDQERFRHFSCVDILVCCLLDAFNIIKRYLHLQLLVKSI